MGRKAKSAGTTAIDGEDKPFAYRPDAEDAAADAAADEAARAAASLPRCAVWACDDCSALNPYTRVTCAKCRAPLSLGCAVLKRKHVFGSEDGAKAGLAAFCASHGGKDRPADWETTLFDAHDPARARAVREAERAVAAAARALKEARKPPSTGPSLAEAVALGISGTVAAVTAAAEGGAKDTPAAHAAVRAQVRAARLELARAESALHTAFNAAGISFVGGAGLAVPTGSVAAAAAAAGDAGPPAFEDDDDDSAVDAADVTATFDGATGGGGGGDDEVMRFLRRLGLARYHGQLRQLGGTSLRFLRHIADADLAADPINMPLLHRRAFLRAVRREHRRERSVVRGSKRDT